MKRVSASIEAYSQPWIPAIMHALGPSCEPRASITGISTGPIRRRLRSITRSGR